MDNLILKFKVKHQNISRLDLLKLVSGSRNYVKAQFSFTDDWNGTTKTARFTCNETTYDMLLDDEDSCLIPWEVINESGFFEVSVFGGDLITVDTSRVYVIESGYTEGGYPVPPTPSIYEQVIAKLEEVEAKVSPEAVKAEVDSYLATIDFVTEDDVENIVSNYVAAHKAELKGDKGDKGDPGEKGEDGAPGKTPTAAEITPIVESVFEAHKSEFVTPTDVPRYAFPTFTSADNGKVLGIVNGALAWVSGGTPTPPSPTLVGEYVSELSLVNAYFKEMSGSSTKAFIQGTCSHDNTLYIGVVDDNDAHNTTVYKYDVTDTTATLNKKVYDYSLGHCNSMTYKDGYIHCVALDNIGTVHRISADDLSYVDSYVVTVPNVPNYSGIGAVTYNDTRKEFAFLIRGNNKGYAIFDENMVYKKTVSIENYDGTFGGIDSDENFIYQTIALPNVIKVFTWDGDYVADIDVSAVTTEIEESAFIGNNLYLGKYLAQTKCNISKWSITKREEFYK